jgi:hypothetical protein
MYKNAVRTYQLEVNLITEAETRFAELEKAERNYLRCRDSTDYWLRSLCPDELEGHEGVTLTNQGVLVVNAEGGNGLTDILRRGRLDDPQHTSFATA